MSDDEEISDVGKVRAALYREGHRVDSLLFLEGTSNLAHATKGAGRDVLELGEREPWGYVVYHGPGPVVRRWKL